jgi:DNA-binding transcriptional LysR family regulator
VGLADELVDRVAEGILDVAILYAPRHRAGLNIELLAEERLVMVTTPPASGGEAEPSYVHVDWGPEFALRQGAGSAGRPDSGVFVGFGPLGLGYILEAGGAGYFRMGAVQPHLEDGRLTLVPGAPEFLYPAYAVHAEAGDAPLIRTALKGLRHAARGVVDERGTQEQPGPGQGEEGRPKRRPRRDEGNAVVRPTR